MDAILCMLQLGFTELITRYCEQKNYTPHWKDILAHVYTSRREDIISFAKQFVNEQYLTAKEIVNVLSGSDIKAVQNTTEFILIYLEHRDDQKEDGELQTKVLEINLKHAPQVAVAIFESEDYKFTHYDRNYIANLCEKAELYRFALMNYEDTNDIAHVLGIDESVVTEEFANKLKNDKLSSDDVYLCFCKLSDYRGSGLNMKFFNQFVEHWSDEMGKKYNVESRFVDFLAKNECWKSLHLYARDDVHCFDTKDKDIIYKYIFAAAEVGKFEDIEYVCRWSTHYDPQQVKKFLMESGKMPNPQALIHLCDRHGYIKELTKYLYDNSLCSFLKSYIEEIGPPGNSGLHRVVVYLLEINAEEKTIRNLINSIEDTNINDDEVCDVLIRLIFQIRLFILHRYWKSG